MAAGLAAEIKEATGLEAQLIPGSGGVFVVELDREQIFSRREESPARFPALGEISPIIKDRLQAQS